MPLDFNGLHRLFTSVELAYELSAHANETHEISSQRMRHAARCAIASGRIERPLYAYAEAIMDAEEPRALVIQLQQLFRRWL